jgi:hypothetical protein
MLPEKYDVTVIITPSGDPRLDDPEAELAVKLKDISRSSIMAPDYGVPLIRNMVKHFEASVFGEEEQPS